VLVEVGGHGREVDVSAVGVGQWVLHDGPADLLEPGVALLAVGIADVADYFVRLVDEDWTRVSGCAHDSVESTHSSRGVVVPQRPRQPIGLNRMVFR
jgi:hypothetical protein